MRSLRLVVVGGDHGARSLFATLQFAGHTVTSVTDVRSAIEAVTAEPPDALVLSDSDVLTIDNALRAQWRTIVSGTRVVSLDALRRDAGCADKAAGSQREPLLDSGPFLRCVDKALVRVANRASLLLIASDPSIERLADALRMRGLGTHATRSTAEASAVLQSSWTQRVLAVIGNIGTQGNALSALDAQLLARGLRYPMVWLVDTASEATPALGHDRVQRVSRSAPWSALWQAVERSERWFERGSEGSHALPRPSR
ncbi:MAG: hypothetical protein AAGA11_06595 [Pseudomonadota bacterium]